MEIWKDIEGYEGLYQVSNYGNVKSLRTNKLLNPSNGEYKQVTLCDKGNRKTISIHRLVAVAFIENKYNYYYINHRDENKHNNYVDNLEWCNKKYNENYGTRNDRISSKLTKYKVVQYDADNNVIKIWNNLREIALTTGFKKTNIASCCRNKIDNAYGYKWQYLVDSK